jgi:hypothetical protein
LVRFVFLVSGNITGSVIRNGVESSRIVCYIVIESVISPRTGSPHLNTTLDCRENSNFIIPSIKSVPVTGLGGLQGCEMLRIPHCLGNRLIDGGKVVSPTHQPHFTPQKHFFLVFPVLISE